MFLSFQMCRWLSFLMFFVCSLLLSTARCLLLAHVSRSIRNVTYTFGFRILFWIVLFAFYRKRNAEKHPFFGKWIYGGILCRSGVCRPVAAKWGNTFDSCGTYLQTKEIVWIAWMQISRFFDVAHTWCDPLHKMTR